MPPWQRIVAYLARHAPEATLPGPASPEAVEALEKGMGVPLPDDFRSWLLGCSGSDEVPLGRWTLAPPLGSLDRSQMMVDLVASGTPVFWDTKWIPLAGDGAGTWLCLESDGSVVLHPRTATSAVDIEPVAASFSRWLDDLADQLEDGRLVVCEDEHGGYDGLVALSTANELGLLVRGETAEERAEKLARRPPVARVAAWLVGHLRRWHLISPPVDEIVAGAWLSPLWSGPPVPDPVMEVRRVLAEHGHEIAVPDADLRAAWRALAGGLLPRDLPRPPRGRTTASAFAHQAFRALDGRLGPGIPPLVQALSEALAAHPVAGDVWRRPATLPVPDELVRALADVLRSGLNLDVSDAPLMASVRACLGPPPDPELAGRLPMRS